MVKPTISTIDSVQEKAAQKAKEAGMVEIPIKTDKEEVEVLTAVEGGKTCCTRRVRKLVSALVIVVILIALAVTLAVVFLGGGPSWLCGTNDAVEESDHMSSWEWKKGKMGDMDMGYPGKHGWHDDDDDERGDDHHDRDDDFDNDRDHDDGGNWEHGDRDDDGDHPRPPHLHPPHGHHGHHGDRSHERPEEDEGEERDV
ncbi:uncharacterized protein [Diadema antillarum]|uniref:uncharacterized protein n=1 Tax=Diadema antillarum TaxID=105358 RepID=UPI003A8C0F82